MALKFMLMFMVLLACLSAFASVFGDEVPDIIQIIGGAIGVVLVIGIPVFAIFWIWS